MPPPTRAPYDMVHVYGVQWEKAAGLAPEQAKYADTVNTEMIMILKEFRDHYNFTHHLKSIPADKAKRDAWPAYFKTQVVGASQDGGGRNLVIIYYHGGGVTNPKDGKLWMKGSKGEQMTYEDAIGNAVIAAKSQVLVLLNCSNAGAVSKSYKQGLNYENKCKDVICSVPAGKSNNRGPTSFANLLDEALSTHRTNWPEAGFKGHAIHWNKVLNNILATKTKDPECPKPTAFHLVAPPADAGTHPIILAPIRAKPAQKK